METSSYETAGASDQIQGPMAASSGVVPGLGRLTEVPPREVWPHEAHHFTPWLLGNVDVLSELLGMDLVLEVAEHPVGGFSLDLKGYDGSTGETVIVENQLEVSDHTHLGQIITYAAGTDPTTIVWVTTGFRPEHRAAIDWLNERTDENTRVFGVVIRVVRIGESTPAPAFELVAQPNDWNKIVKKATARTNPELSQRGATYQEFWEVVTAKVSPEHPSWVRKSPSTGSYYDTHFGVPGVVGPLGWTRDGLVSQIYMLANDPALAQTRFQTLFDSRKHFEEILGETPVWDPMENRKATRVSLVSAYTDIEDRAAWPDMIDWLIDSQVRLRTAWNAVAETAGAVI